MEADVLSPAESVLTWLSGSEELPPSLAEEQRAAQKIHNYQATSPDDITKEILSAFQEHLPWDGRHALVSFIAGADDGELLQLAYHLYTAILLPLQAHSQHAVTPSPFVDSQECEGDVYQTMLESASRNDQARLKKLCLERDGWKCMLSNGVDISQRKKHPTNAASTRLAHILPLSIGKGSDKASEHRISQIWATLHRLFPAVTICPSDVNHSSNLMTLIVPFESCLGNFSLALEPTYEILTFPDFEYAYSGFLPKPNKDGARIVRFRSHNELPLPSPAILRAHASIAKIVKSNDIFERIQKVLEMPQTTRHLSTDGASDLDFLFWKL